MQRKEEQAVTKDATDLLFYGGKEQKFGGGKKKHIKMEGLKLNPVLFFTNK